MDNNAAEILERIIFNEDDRIKKIFKNANRRWKRAEDKHKKQARYAAALGVGAGVATVGGLLAWQHHVNKKAEEEAKKKAEQKG